jgi:hypothetical protein
MPFAVDTAGRTQANHSQRQHLHAGSNPHINMSIALQPPLPLFAIAMLFLSFSAREETTRNHVEEPPNSNKSKKGCRSQLPCPSPRRRMKEKSMKGRKAEQRKEASEKATTQKNRQIRKSSKERCRSQLQCPCRVVGLMGEKGKQEKLQNSAKEPPNSKRVRIKRVQPQLR